MLGITGENNISEHPDKYQNDNKRDDQRQVETLPFSMEISPDIDSVVNTRDLIDSTDYMEIEELEKELRSDTVKAKNDAHKFVCIFSYFCMQVRR